MTHVFKIASRKCICASGAEGIESCHFASMKNEPRQCDFLNRKGGVGWERDGPPARMMLSLRWTP